MNKLKLPICFFYRKYFILTRVDFRFALVVGKAIHLHIIDFPSKEEIEFHHHSVYLNRLKELY
jgi:hypothetical protein